MNTKEVCVELSVTPKTLRVYEEQKLIAPCREENNYREYSADDLLRIRIVRVLRDLDFSLKEIRSVLAPTEGKPDLLQSFYLQAKAIETRIRELNHTKLQLNQVINKLLEAGERNAEELEEILRSGQKTDEKTTYEKTLERWNFDMMAVDYINRYLKEDKAYLNSIRIVEGVLKKEATGKRIVDVGGGTCYLWRRFPKSTDLTILDRSLPMIQAGKDAAPWARFIYDDITTLNPERYTPFDHVVSTFTFHHIPYEEQLVAIRNLLALAGQTGDVFLVDRSFRDSREAAEAENRLIEAKDEARLEIFRSEYYLIVDVVVRIARGFGWHLDAFPIEENIWGYRFKKLSKN